MLALLGALLANNKAFERVAEFLAPEHFADPIHGRIFAAIHRRINNGQLADAITLRPEFEHTGLHRAPIIDCPGMLSVPSEEGCCGCPLIAAHAALAQ